MQSAPLPSASPCPTGLLRFLPSSLPRQQPTRQPPPSLSPPRSGTRALRRLTDLPAHGHKSVLPGVAPVLTEVPEQERASPSPRSSRRKVLFSCGSQAAPSFPIVQQPILQKSGRSEQHKVELATPRCQRMVQNQHRHFYFVAFKSSPACSVRPRWYPASVPAARLASSSFPSTRTRRWDLFEDGVLADTSSKGQELVISDQHWDEVAALK